MARRLRIAFPVLLLIAYGGWAQAQAAPLQSNVAEQGIAQISLGQAAVPLYGPWKFMVGDSPLDPSPMCHCGLSRGLTTRSGRQ